MKKKIDKKWKYTLLWQLSARSDFFYHNYVNINNNSHIDVIFS